MTEPAAENEAKPSTRAFIKPFELVAFALILGVFAGGITVFTTRNVELALIVTGLGFIGALMVVSIMALALRPNPEDRRAREAMRNNSDVE